MASKLIYEHLRLLGYISHPMYKFPGERTNVLVIDHKPYKQYGYPNLGATCLVKVLKTTFLCANVEIYQVNGLPTMIPFTGLIKLQDFTTTEYISDIMKIGDTFECTVVSYGDLGIYVTLMTQRRNLKRNLNLIKKSIEEQPRYKIELNDLPKRMNNNVSDVDSGDQIDSNRQEINFSTVKDLDNTQNNTIKDTQNSTIKDTQNSTMWSSDEELYNALHDDNDFCQSIPNSKSSPVLFKSKWNRKKYNVDFKKIKKGTEIGDFIDAHPDFTISNLISTFEEIEILEYGLSTPRFDFRFDFEQSSIKTGIDLEIIPKGANKREVVKNLTVLIALDDKNLFEINKFVNVRIIGDKITSFELKNKIYRTKKVNKIVCLFSEDTLITYDLKRLRKWKISATDATENNLGEFIVLESDKIINVYKDDRLIHRVELNTLIDNIASYYDRKIIVSTIYKLIFILDLDTKHIELISGPPNDMCRSLEVHNNLVIVQTRSKLYFIDLANKTKHFARFQKDFKISCGRGVVRAYDFKDTFRYFNMLNPLDNLSLTYKDHIKGFDFYEDCAYLAIEDSIKFYKDGKLTDVIDAFFKHEDYDFENTIFTEDDFDRWKRVYNQRTNEDLEFIPNDLNNELKKDLDKILGRDKVKNTFAASQTSVSSQKRKKGGF